MARKTVIIRNGRTDGRRWRIIIHFIRRRIQLSRNELYCFIYWVLESMLYFEYFIYIFLSFIYDKNLVILLKIASFETVVDFCQRRLSLLDERKGEFLSWEQFFNASNFPQIFVESCQRGLLRLERWILFWKGSCLVIKHRRGFLLIGRFASGRSIIVRWILIAA